MVPRRKFIDAAVSRLEKYMAEKGRPLTTKEIAEFLGVSPSSAGNVMLYMEAVDLIQHVKRGRKKYYFLKGAFDESEISSLIPSLMSIHKARRLKLLTRKRIGTDDVLKEHLASIRTQANSGEGFSALSIIGLTQTEGEQTLVKEPESIKEAITKADKKKTPLFIKREPIGPVESIPKDFRLLTHEHTKYLKEQHLRGLDGYAKIDVFNCFFAEASALEGGEYGRVFYASNGTNPWERAYKLTVLSRK